MTCSKKSFWTFAFSPWTESAADPGEPRKNRLLQEAVRALLASSPLFHTQTLTLQGLPVPDHTDDISTTAREAPSSATNCRKRLREMLPEKERKRRRSKSWVQDVSKFCRMFLEPVCLKELLLIKFVSKKDSSGSFYLSRCKVQTLHAQMEDWFDLGFQLWHFGVCSRCSVLESSGFYLFFGFKVFAWPSVDLVLTKKRFHTVFYFSL